MVDETIQIKLLTEDATIPTYATPGSSGMDLYAADDTVIPSGKHALVRTGIAIAMPDCFEGQIRPRSGLAVKHGITVLNSPGTIDSDYRGEIKVCLFNKGWRDYIVKPGMRIAQLVFAPVFKVQLEPVDDLPDTTRSNGGFGHTGD